MNLLLTTYPAHQSRNVGDHLISSSTKKLVHSFYPSAVFCERFRGVSLCEVELPNITCILAPGFSVANGTYPHLYSLTDDLDKLPPFFPLGCSLQIPNFAGRTSLDFKYDSQTFDFLLKIQNKIGSFPCRDQLIADCLLSNGINAHYFGDLALYDLDHLHKKFVPPDEVRSIVFTIAHAKKYIEQQKKVLTQLAAEFKNAKRYVSYHSVPTPTSLSVGRFANELGFESLLAHGESENLAAYSDIDLHVGYRLHGHIAFLRQRKPSILLVEDERSFGFHATPATSHGTILAFNEVTGEIDDYAPNKSISLVREEILLSFDRYEPIFDFIDDTYQKIVSPYFLDLDLV